MIVTVAVGIIRDTKVSVSRNTSILRTVSIKQHILVPIAAKITAFFRLTLG